MRVSISQALSISQLLLGLVIQTSVILLLFSQIKDRMNAHGNIMMYLLARRLSVEVWRRRQRGTRAEWGKGAQEYLNLEDEDCTFSLIFSCACFSWSHWLEKMYYIMRDSKKRLLVYLVNKVEE